MPCFSERCFVSSFLTNEPAVMVFEHRLDRQNVRPHEASNSTGMELIDCIELPVLVVDLDLTLVSFNPAAAKLLSLTGSDVADNCGRSRCSPESRTFRSYASMSSPAGPHTEWRSADGAGSWFSVSIGCHKANQNINGAVLTLTNVTAFRESLERAIEEREYTKAVINTIADALVIVDGDLRIQAANQAFYALFQTSRERSQGADFYQLGNGKWDVPRTPLTDRWGLSTE